MSVFTQMAQKDWFENGILLVIVLNSVWIGVDLEMNQEGAFYVCWDTFELFGFVENIFCLVFSFEVVVRLLQYKNPFYFFMDSSMLFWNYFDFFLVALMVFETWVAKSPLRPFQIEELRLEADAGTEKEKGGLSQFRMLRLLR